jgi:SAM-dependent methyltransferase
MNVREAERLIARVIPQKEGTWADLGAGSGIFTRALSEILGSKGRIYAVDRDAGAIAALERWAKKAVADVIPVRADFTRPFDLPGLGDAMLDGLLFANALHFVRDADHVLARLTAWLRPGSRVVFVEYDRRPRSRWVPYLLPPERLSASARVAGLSVPVIAASRPSAYGGQSIPGSGRSGGIPQCSPVGRRSLVVGSYRPVFFTMPRR